MLWSVVVLTFAHLSMDPVMKWDPSCDLESDVMVLECPTSASVSSNCFPVCRANQQRQRYSFSGLPASQARAAWGKPPCGVTGGHL